MISRGFVFLKGVSCAKDVTLLLRLANKRVCFSLLLRRNLSALNVSEQNCNVLECGFHCTVMSEKICTNVHFK